MNSIFWLVPASSILALSFAWFFFKQMMKESEGTDTMKKIAKHVRDGAMAYLKQQYKIVGIVFVILAVIFSVMAYFNLQNAWVPFAFLTGGFFSGLAAVSYTHLRAHETRHDLVCRLLLEKKKK